jgi:hemoglobin
MATLYEHAGGGEGARHRFEEIFYTKVLSDPVLKALFTERRPHHVEHLTWFTAESFGGPDRFTRDLAEAELPQKASADSRAKGSCRVTPRGIG